MWPRLHQEMDFDGMLESDTSTSSYEKSKKKTFIEWLQEQTQGQSLLVAVPRQYIIDDFNLYDLEAFLPSLPVEFKNSNKIEKEIGINSYLKLITGKAPDSELLKCDEEYSREITVAINIYLIIHQRYIQTRQGQQVMEGIIEGTGKIPCRRVFCYGTPMLPTGESSRIGVSPVRFWCPSCKEIYSVGSGNSVTLDGAAFGPNFPLMYLMSFKGKGASDIMSVNPGIKVYEPKIFGFRVRPGIPSFCGSQAKKFSMFKVSTNP